jgi:hypothetical protein
MSRESWALVGLFGGAAVGALWGLAGGDVEAGDAAIGTGLMCGVAGFLLVAVTQAVQALVRRGRRGRPR